MQSEEKKSKLIVKDGYLICPVCRRKTSQKVLPSTKAENIPVFCRHCKSVPIVNIENSQCFLSQC